MSELPQPEQLLEAFPDVRLDGDNAGYYDGLLHHEVRLSYCRGCRRWFRPLAALCPRCWSTDVEMRPVSGRGVVFMRSRLTHGRETPGITYPTLLIVVTLEDQQDLRIEGVCSEESIRIGDEVVLDWTNPVARWHPTFRVARGERR